MFKKSKVKIVASIMTIMTLLLAGTFGVIYFTSYREMSEKDERMLERYCEMYDDEDGFSKPDKKNMREDDRPPQKREDERAYDAAAIYSVSFDEDNEVENIDNSSQSMTNEELTALAKTALESDGSKGKLNGYNYLIQKTDDYTLVVFMDSSNFDKNAETR